MQAMHHVAFLQAKTLKLSKHSHYHIYQCIALFKHDKALNIYQGVQYDSVTRQYKVKYTKSTDVHRSISNKENGLILINLI